MSKEGGVEDSTSAEGNDGANKTNFESVELTPGFNSGKQH